MSPRDRITQRRSAERTRPLENWIIARLDANDTLRSFIDGRTTWEAVTRARAVRDKYAAIWGSTWSRHSQSAAYQLQRAGQGGQ